MLEGSVGELLRRVHALDLGRLLDLAQQFDPAVERDDFGRTCAAQVAEPAVRDRVLDPHAPFCGDEVLAHLSVQVVGDDAHVPARSLGGAAQGVRVPPVRVDPQCIRADHDRVSVLAVEDALKTRQVSDIGRGADDGRRQLLLDEPTPQRRSTAGR